MLGSDDMALNFIHFLSFFESPFRLLDEFANIRYWTTYLLLQAWETIGTHLSCVV